jgi:hypothetical protein
MRRGFCGADEIFSREQSTPRRSYFRDFITSISRRDASRLATG